jgi:hypothetical protein
VVSDPYFRVHCFSQIFTRQRLTECGNHFEETVNRVQERNLQHTEDEMTGDIDEAIKKTRKAHRAATRS